MYNCSYSCAIFQTNYWVLIYFYNKHKWKGNIYTPCLFCICLFIHVYRKVKKVKCDFVNTQPKHWQSTFTICHSIFTIYNHLKVMITTNSYHLNKKWILFQTHRYSHGTLLFISNEGHPSKGCLKKDIIRGADPRVSLGGGGGNYVSASTLRARNEKCLSPGV